MELLVRNFFKWVTGFGRELEVFGPSFDCAGFSALNEAF